jgi:hypothetical protein
MEEKSVPNGQPSGPTMRKGKHGTLSAKTNCYNFLLVSPHFPFSFLVIGEKGLLGESLPIAPEGYVDPYTKLRQEKSERVKSQQKKETYNKKRALKADGIALPSECRFSFSRVFVSTNCCAILFSNDFSFDQCSYHSEKQI